MDIFLYVHLETQFLGLFRSLILKWVYLQSKPASIEAFLSYHRKSMCVPWPSFPLWSIQRSLKWIPLTADLCYLPYSPLGWLCDQQKHLSTKLSYYHSVFHQWGLIWTFFPIIVSPDLVFVCCESIKQFKCFEFSIWKQQWLLRSLNECDG